MGLSKTHLKHGGNNIQLPDTIIVHAMGEFILTEPPRHAVKFLDFAKLSAHSLVAPDGHEYQCRYDTEVAWHALKHNTNTLGIEFLVPGSHNMKSLVKTMDTDYVTELAYQTGLARIKFWLNEWPIKTITRHSDIDPERKVDPGDGFPWERLMNDISMEGSL